MKPIDKYVYPGTTVLINKFNCRDERTLKEIEALSTGGNLAFLQIHPIDGKFDFEHLKRIHQFIFQDLYEWAGQIRTVDIGKNNLFCRTQFINDYARAVFKDFFESCYEMRDDKPAFIEALSSHYADLNALHPFREGNGRTQREFIRELCLECGYILDLTRTTHEEMLEASIESFNKGDCSGFITIFNKCVIPEKQYANYQSKLTSSLLILSEDDWKY